MASGPRMNGVINTVGVEVESQIFAFDVLSEFIRVASRENDQTCPFSPRGLGDHASILVKVLFMVNVSSAR